MANAPPLPVYELSVGVEGGYAGGSSGFDGNDFTVPGNGPLIGTYFDARTFISPGVSIGARFGGLLGGYDGTRFNDATRSDHKVDVSRYAYAEAEVGFRAADLTDFGRLRAGASAPSCEGYSNFFNSCFSGGTSWTAAFGAVLSERDVDGPSAQVASNPTERRRPG